MYRHVERRPCCSAHQQTGLPAVRGGRLAALDAPLLFDPGERWDYGIGIDWAGRMVEAVSGERLDAYFRNDIFVPLGISGHRISS